MFTSFILYKVYYIYKAGQETSLRRTEREKGSVNKQFSSSMIIYSSK